MLNPEGRTSTVENLCIIVDVLCEHYHLLPLDSRMQLSFIVQSLLVVTPGSGI